MERQYKAPLQMPLYLYEFRINPRRHWYTLWLKVHSDSYLYSGPNIQQARSKLFKLHGLCIVHKIKNLGRACNT